MAEKVIRGRRPPPVLRLARQERLGQEPAARLDGVEKRRHAVTIEVEEHHDHIKRLRSELVGRQIGLRPDNWQFPFLCLSTTDVQARRVIVDGCHVGAEPGRRDRVTALPTRKVERFNATVKELLMPGEPAAGAGGRSSSK